MPIQTGMAFVVVQHLSPDFKSLMDELLARKTEIPIHRASHGMEVQPDAIYLIRRKDMIIANRRLLLNDKDAKSKSRSSRPTCTALRSTAPTPAATFPNGAWGTSCQGKMLDEGGNRRTSY